MATWTTHDPLDQPRTNWRPLLVIATVIGVLCLLKFGRRGISSVVSLPEIATDPLPLVSHWSPLP